MIYRRADYQQVRLIREEVGDRYGERITRYNMVMIYRGQGRLQAAVAELMDLPGSSKASRKIVRLLIGFSIRQVVELDRQVQHPDLESDLATLAEVEAALAGGAADNPASAAADGGGSESDSERASRPDS